MAADVGSLTRVLGTYGHHNRCGRHHDQTAVNESISAGESTVLITRDFLGGSSSSSSSPSSSRVEVQELDLDLEVPSGFEKRLDLKSGKVYLQRCNSANPSTSPSEQKHDQTNQAISKLQDLNFPPPSSKPSLSLFEEQPSMELNLFPSPSSFNFQSVCTLDKVKSALERAERQSTKKQSPLHTWSKSPSPLRPSSLIKETEAFCEEKPMSSSLPAGLLFAAGCPSCLLYVLISKSNPKCPRCHTIVPSPTMLTKTTTTAKKPRLDLNISV